MSGGAITYWSNTENSLFRENNYENINISMKIINSNRFNSSLFEQSKILFEKSMKEEYKHKKMLEWKQHQTKQFLDRLTLLFKSLVLKNTYLTTLWKQWKISIKHMETQLRLFFMFNHISHVQGMIECKESLMKWAEMSNLQESDFISFTEYYEPNSRLVKLRYV